MDGRPFALVVWPRADPDVRGKFSFFASRADAVAAAPPGEPYSVVDVTRRAPPFPTVDAENLQLYGGTGEANGQVNGLITNSNVLGLTATGTTEFFTDIAAGIAALRTGPALAEPDLCLLHPNTWATIRTAKDQYGRFLASVDPTTETAETIWSIPVVQSTQFTAGQAVLVDSTRYGRVVVREGLLTRIGYSGTDFVTNVIRFLSEERLTQTIERPQAICIVKGLPTAAPTLVGGAGGHTAEPASPRKR